MKIVFVNRYYAPDFSSSSALLSDVATGLAAERWPVHVVTSRQRYDDPRAHLPSDETIAGVQVHRVWTTRFGRAGLAGRACDYATFFLSAAWMLLRLLGRGDVVVAKTDPPLISTVAAMAAALRGARLVNWLQDVFPEVASALGFGWATRGPGRLLSALRDWSLKRATVNVAIGDRMAARLAGRGVDSRAIVVIPNWSDGRLIVPLDRESNTLRNEWGLAGCFVVGYSGNMGRAHDLETILGAAERLRDEPRIRFLFIGAGNQREAIARAAADKGLVNIDFKPYQDRSRLALSLTVPDVHVVSLLPALEGLIVPSKFYGVAAAGRATLFIGSADGEIGQLLSAERCGTTVACGDAITFADTVRRWSRDADEVAAMGARARVLFDARFDQQIAIRRWRDLLEPLLRAGAASTPAPGRPRAAG